MPLLLYSTVSALAYSINEKYYGGLHYCWCAPNKPRDRLTGTNPPSSDPWSVWTQFHRDVRGNDGHSAIIARNRAGIARGAQSSESQGRISPTVRKTIEEIAAQAPIAQFAPLMMIIPCSALAAMPVPVPLIERASLLSEEYVLSDLHRDKFDILEYGAVYVDL